VGTSPEEQRVVGNKKRREERIAEKKGVKKESGRHGTV